MRGDCSESIPDILSGRLVDAAVSKMGMNSSPKHMGDYSRFLFPHPDDEPFRIVMAKQMSSCALFALSVMREAGIVHDMLEEPYHKNMGKAVYMVCKILTDLGCWLGDKSSDQICAGDIVVVGDNTNATYGGVEHVFIVASIDSEGIMETIDGGQRNGSDWCIDARKRKVDGAWVRTCDHEYSIDKPGKGRRIRGFGCVKKITHGLPTSSL